MTRLPVADPAALEAALEALPRGTWVAVVPGPPPPDVPGEDPFDPADYAETVLRVPGGWYLPGDLVVASGDVADGRPLRVEVVGGA
ncbi:hypothetical protein [Serinicoccus marinus]|uniref:hypothetical protein n=1 Tax=Serinicoccus marinus TaxID=247333 RepID=UPI0024937A25|nr:hypothetical protein [Serinicoccus marinus]